MKSIVRPPLAALGAISVLWTQAAALLIDDQPRGLKHTLRCGRWDARPSAAQYVVDGSLAKGRGKGVGYHFSKSLQDRDIRTLAHWGAVVPGVDQGDGWLLVGECYLPMDLDGKRVVRPVPRVEAPKAAPGPAAAAAGPRDAAAFAAGDAVEMWSPKSKKWYAVVVDGSGAQPGTFQVRLPMAAAGRRALPAVPAASLRRAPEPAQSFAQGEAAEFLAGAADSTWTGCIVEGRGRLPGTYTIRVAAPGTPAGGGRTFAIPGGWLRKRAPPPRAAPPAKAAPGGAPPQLAKDGGVAAALQRLHSSYAEIKQLLDAQTLPAS